MSTQSEAIVGFIANLLPLYSGEEIEGRKCAVSMVDGTVIAPVPVTEDDDDQDWIVFRWQGDPNRTTEVMGSMFASQAVLRYVELRGVGRPAEELTAEREHLAQHFTFKTGASLYFAEGIKEPELLRAMRKAVSKLGPAVVLSLLKAHGV
jgi:hypothetical protein